ncbi:hypothetical protein C8F04DRAFT_1073671 [Mycena alexandri]|uniref:Uncharacterized protein n=1 Tax=Mycena alexandri TaxID=1745969 RepID=A0AAD6TD29_9AGAR|nr:hypothetical protein C8F04DRAFT_1073671 [Mycena alexandri]
MDANIGEPFHLASYGVAQRLNKSKAGKSPRPSANVFATHEKFASGSSDGYVTVTAQGDGVHVLDLSTLHPVISHTLGPSTSFSCPSVTLNAQEGPRNIYTTYAVIASSADVSQEDCGRTIWKWRENLSSTAEDRASQKKKSAVMPHPISELYACNSTPPRLVVLSPAGDLTVVDADLKIRGTIPPPSGGAAILKSFVFPRESSSFLSALSGSTVIVLLEHHSHDATTSLRILDVSGDGEAREVANTKIPVKSDQIVNLSCSPSGYLSILTRDGTWNSFQIESKSDGISVYSAAQPLRLAPKSLTFLGKPPDASLDGEISILALNTSVVLLAGITSSPSRNIVLLIWDLQFSVLLASHVLAVPTTHSHLPKLSITLRLVTATSPQALLILSSPASDAQVKSTTPARSNILVVPLTVPPMSTIGNAMGRSAAGAQWLVQPNANETLGPARAEVLAAVQRAMADNQPQTAEKAFFDWEKSEQPSADEDASSAEATPPVALGHSFVHDLLTALLQPPKPSSTYSSVLVRSLLQRRVVSASMVEGGNLLAALKLRNDWTAIELCTTTVTDLSEADLMFILQHVAQHHRHAVSSTDAMDLDPPTLGAILKLPTFLNACVRYQTAPATLRAAMHQYLTQPEDVVAVLEVLDGWVGRWKVGQVVALPPKASLRKNEHGVAVLKEGWQKDPTEYPPLIKVLSFIQTTLDASFLALLQHTPAHRILREVLSRIEPEIQLTEQVDLLRGPLELFARAQAKAVRDGKEGKKELVGDWRQRRRLVHERQAMAVDRVYQLEEIVL